MTPPKKWVHFYIAIVAAVCHRSDFGLKMQAVGRFSNSENPLAWTGNR